MYACTHIWVETSKLFEKAGLPVDAVPSPGRASGVLHTGGEIGQASNRRRASERLAADAKERGGPGERARRCLAQRNREAPCPALHRFAADQPVALARQFAPVCVSRSPTRRTSSTRAKIRLSGRITTRMCPGAEFACMPRSWRSACRRRTCRNGVGRPRVCTCVLHSADQGQKCVPRTNGKAARQELRESGVPATD